MCFYYGATVVWPRPHWRHSVVYQGFTGITHMHIYIRAAVRGALDFSLLRNGKCQWLRLYLATQLIVLWQVTSVLLSFLPFLAKTETDKPNALNKFVENLLENWTRTMANQEGIFVDETFHCAHHNRICHSSFFFFFYSTWSILERLLHFYLRLSIPRGFVIIRRGFHFRCEHT